MEREQWLEERRGGIGGSDAAAICGVSPWRTPLMVWEEKTGLAPKKVENEAMFWGTTLEPVIRQRYSDLTGREVKVPNEILRHPTHNWMIGNIDGFTDEPRGLEIKTAGYPDGWGEPGTDEIPVHYIFQVQHYLAITGFPVFDVPVLIGGRDFRIYHVYPDAELQGMIIQKEEDFYEAMVSGCPPDPVTYEDVTRLYKTSKEESVFASKEIEDLVISLRLLRKELDIFEQNEKEVKRKIMEFMGNSDTLRALDGETLVTWKYARPAQRFDAQALEKDQPDIYKQYLKSGDSSRRFLIK